MQKKGKKKRDDESEIDIDEESEFPVHERYVKEGKKKRMKD